MVKSPQLLVFAFSVCITSSCGPIWTNGPIEFVRFKLTPKVTKNEERADEFNLQLIVATKLPRGSSNTSAFFFKCGENRLEPDQWHAEKDQSSYWTSSVSEMDSSKIKWRRVRVMLTEVGNFDRLLIQDMPASRGSNSPKFKWHDKLSNEQICLRLRSATTTHWFWSSELRIDKLMKRDDLIGSKATTSKE